MFQNEKNVEYEVRVSDKFAIRSREDEKFQAFLFTKCVHSYNLFIGLVIRSLNVPI